MSNGGIGVTYIINQRTQAITSIETNYYRTIIYEENDIIYETATPMEILAESCLYYGSAYEGRKELSRKILKSNSKLPFVIDPDLGIFFMPTTSHRNHSCAWFSYFHIKDFIQLQDKLAVKLNNDQIIYVNVSQNQFDQQMKRTSQVIAYFYKLYITQNKMVLFISD